MRMFDLVGTVPVPGMLPCQGRTEPPREDCLRSIRLRMPPITPSHPLTRLQRAALLPLLRRVRQHGLNQQRQVGAHVEGGGGSGSRSVQARLQGGGMRGGRPGG